VVVSDWDAVNELVCHGRSEDRAEAGEHAINAGLDVDMASKIFVEHLPELVRTGRVSEARLDEAVRRVLSLKESLGLFENPYADEGAAQTAMLSESSVESVLELTRRSLVLLKNQGNLLPLENIKTLGVFGPMAGVRSELFGTWTLDGEAQDVVPIRDVLKGMAPSGTKILDCDLADEAISRARLCEAAIVVVGESPQRSGENNCVTTLDLPAGQLELLKGLKKVGVSIIAVVICGRPLDLSWLEENVEAILLAWHPGIVGGRAIADVVYGHVCPSGKLPITFPRSLGQVPIYYGRKNTGRPLDPYQRGMSRYVDSLDSPLYEFGFGLSYTSFEYSNLSVDGLNFSVTVKNTGSYDSEEIVQLYIRDEVSRMVRPIVELKGFERISLKVGEQKKVTFQLNRDSFGYYGVNEEWTVEPGWFTVRIGPNVRDGLETRIELR
jgi:beta-glucosidase